MPQPGWTSACVRTTLSCPSTSRSPLPFVCCTPARKPLAEAPSPLMIAGIAYFVKYRGAMLLAARATNDEGPPGGRPLATSFRSCLRGACERHRRDRGARRRRGRHRRVGMERPRLLARDVERDRDRPARRRRRGVHLVLRAVGRSDRGDVRPARAGAVLGAPVDARVRIADGGVAGVWAGAIHIRDVLARGTGPRAA